MTRTKEADPVVNGYRKVLHSYPTPPRRIPYNIPLTVPIENIKQNSNPIYDNLINRDYLTENNNKSCSHSKKGSTGYILISIELYRYWYQMWLHSVM